MNTIAIDFQKKARPKLVHVEGGVYQYETKPGAFYERPVIQGKQTVRKLGSTTLGKAKLELARKRSEQARAKIGIAPDPYLKVKSGATVAELIEFYAESSCPRRNEQLRTGTQLDQEKWRLEKLREFFGSLSADKISMEDCREYHRHRLTTITRGVGHRAVDIELVTLSNVFTWATRNERRTGVSKNPFKHDRIQFRASETIRHCREFQPESGDELHALARHFFGNPQSEVLGWQLLFEAFIGQRTHETLKLRTDATTRYQPGFIEGNHLWLFDSKTHKGTFPYIEIHAALRQCLAAHKTWLENRYPENAAAGWFFPGRDPGNPVDKSALTHALARTCKAMGLPHRTSHGLRSFHVNVLRSQGKTDAEIALRIGHRSGGKLIVDVYGEILPTKLHWLPKEDAPAWAIFDPAANQRPLQLEMF